MRILVTGGAGFIGSNVVDRYIELGHSVIIVDDLSSGKQENINPAAEFHKLDITTSEFKELIVKLKPDIINHLAAQMDVRVSVENPLKDANINILGLLNVLTGAVDSGTVKKVIFSSSGGVVYGENNIDRAFVESDPYNPLSPYGVSKLASEFYIKCYKEIHNLKFTILRYANVYGPRQAGGEAGVISIFIKAILNDTVPKIFGDGTQTRDYVFVKDVVKANEFALENGDNNIFNIGTGRLTSVNQLYDIISNMMEFNQKPIHETARAGELLRNYLDTGKLRKVSGWAPDTSLEIGLPQTINFFKGLL